MRSCSETARSRRASYQNQRSQTLDALPLQLIHPAPLVSSTDQRSSLDSQDEAGSASEESRLLGSTEGSPFHASRENSHHSSSGGRGTTARLTLAKNLSFQNVLSENALLNHHQRGPLSGSGSTRSSKMFLRKSSDNDLLYSGCSSSSTRIHLERSPSSSSALLAKVKDRIVDTFFQTSSEGPHLAAIVQERRQRAAEEYEARLSLFRAQHQLPTTSSRPGSLSSDSGSTERVHSNQGSTRRSRTLVGEGSASGAGQQLQTPVDTEALRFAKSRRDGARAAFRRRSVSEDNCLPLQGLHAAKAARCPAVLGNGSVAGSQAGGLQGGIVCSTDDFQALVMSGLGHRRGLSFGGSRSRCMGPRAMSFDQSRQLRPSGSLFGDYGPGDSNCGLMQRMSNSSKILETFEEAASECPGAATPFGGLTRRGGPHDEEDEDGEDPTSHHRKNPLGSTANRLSNGSTEVPSLQHRKQMSTTELVHHNNNNNTSGSGDSPTSAGSGSGHVPLVPEVEFDSNGQTWDVYGAELDPEILGSAIQIHLSKLIARNIEASSSNNHDALVTRPPSPRDRHHSVVVVNDCRDVPPHCCNNSSREPADIGCLRRYFCIFSAGDDS